MSAIKSQLRSALRRLYNSVRHPRPAGLAAIGSGAVIQCPRQLQGAKSIRVGQDTTILSNSWISAIQRYQGIQHSPSVNIGDRVYIGHGVCLSAMREVTIGDDCVLSERIYISDCAHGIDPTAGPILKQPLMNKGPVRIGNSTFIGYGAAILPGVILGKHCVVGANSVVTHSFPDYSMVAGSPAKLLKRYSVEEERWIPAPP